MELRLALHRYDPLVPDVFRLQLLLATSAGWVKRHQTQVPEPRDTSMVNVLTKGWPESSDNSPNGKIVKTEWLSGLLSNYQRAA